MTDKPPYLRLIKNWSCRTVGAKVPAGRARSERLLIMLSLEELAAIDDFRFATRMPNRAAAVRELLRRALSAEGFPVPAPSKKSP
jgi:hypothetical protein